MQKSFVAPKEGPPAVGPYSPGVIANGFLFVSGQIPINPQTGEIIQGSFESQLRQTLDNLKRVIEAAGASLMDVVKITVFLADLNNFSEMNAIYSEYFSDSKPARSCVQAARLPKDIAVEIEAIVCMPTTG